MKISVVILHYQAEPFLHLCLDSVRRAARRFERDSSNETEIFVADNHSIDFDVQEWKKTYPDVLFERYEKNLGFAAGNNRAVRSARGDYVLLLNPDTVVPEDLLVQLKELILRRPDSGIVGVRLIDGRGRFLPESKRNLPSLAGAVAKLTGADKIFSFPLFKPYYNMRLAEDECGPNDVFVGAFMFFKRKDFLVTGGFDERFFMYGEDIDLSRRFKEAGKQGYYCGKLKALHFKGESTPKTPRYRKYFIEAAQLYNRKHSPRRAFLLNFFTSFLLRAKFWKENLKKIFAPSSPAGLPSSADLFDRYVAQAVTPMELEETGLPAPGTLIVFDTSRASYASMLDFMVRRRKKNYRYRFYLPARFLIIGSDSSLSRGEVLTSPKRNE